MDRWVDDIRHHYQPPKTFVKSAVRALAVLEFFYRRRQPARAVEIGEELELPVSSAKYLLTSLVEAGYLTFDKTSKRYFPSILLTGFASWLAGIYPSGEVLRSLARELHRQTGEIISVAVQHEQYMRALIIETESATTPPAYDFRVRIPLVGSASGGIALTAASDDQVGEIIDREVRKLPPEKRADQAARILERVHRFRRQGYSVNFGEAAGDDIAVAVPLPRPQHTPPMALGIYGPRERLGGREAALAQILYAAIDRYRDSLAL